MAKQTFLTISGDSANFTAELEAKMGEGYSPFGGIQSDGVNFTSVMVSNEPDLNKPQPPKLPNLADDPFTDRKDNIMMVEKTGK